MDSFISSSAVSATVFEPVASVIFVAVIPSVVLIAVVFPSTSFGILKVFAEVSSTAKLLKRNDVTISSIVSLTATASAFNAAVSEALLVVSVSAKPICFNRVASEANSNSADSAAKSISCAVLVADATCLCAPASVLSAIPCEKSPLALPANTFNPVDNLDMDSLIFCSVLPKLIAGYRAKDIANLFNFPDYLQLLQLLFPNLLKFLIILL